MRTIVASLIMMLAAPLSAAPPSAYDHEVLTDRPVYFLGTARGQTYTSGRAAEAAPLPNGDQAIHFDGEGQSLSVPSRRHLSIDATGALTVEAWIRPDVLQFTHTEGEGYVYWLGKGEADMQEYAGRMYSRVNPVHRPNRISGYAFNPDGGLGSGAYFQDDVRAGEWIHVAIVYTMSAVSIYKDGALRDTVPMSQFNVTPVGGGAPLRIGTRDGDSYFAGAIGKVAVYDHAVPVGRLVAHKRAMTGS